ncbi:MAG: methyltransferase domain-containing protein [Candidatus Cloacimonetes bacterium]|nr:methyltransferase domain-containing protein [Candidatus Cloacimonadota bacterium]
MRTILAKETAENLRLLDLGSGNGIISIMISHYKKSWKCCGLEINPLLHELAIENARLSGSKSRFILGDLRNFDSAEKFDLITSNPPYYPCKHGHLSPNPERAASRHEILCRIDDIIAAVCRVMKDTGTAYIMYPESRWLEFEKKTKKVDLIIRHKNITENTKKVRFIAEVEKYRK